MSTEKIVHDEGAKLDLSSDMSYGDYLHLDEVLGAQHPRSPEHNEMLFIVQHQTTELWMKLLLHELSAAIRCVVGDELGSAFKMLARVSRIMEQLVHAWDVLATMTPSEYSAIRPYLASSSGFQSWQYRCIEFMLGNKNAAMLKVFDGEPTAQRLLTELLEAPTLYDEFLRLMARQGFDVPAAVLERDHREPWTFQPALVPVFRQVYESTETPWGIYEACESLVDVEDNFQMWRFRHLLTVQRTIGFKTGTGGSSGVGFLRRALDLTFFPELYAVRTEIGT